MYTVFKKSAAASAVRCLLSALIPIVVGLAFGGVLIYAKEILTIVKVTAILAIIGSAWMTLKLFGEAVAYMRSGEEWRVEITQQHLLWHSPVQDLMQSFQVPLNHISALRRITYIAKNSKTSPKNNYFIELHTGQTIKIDDQISGIGPRKVFKALGEIGVPFHEDIERLGSSTRIGF